MGPTINSRIKPPDVGIPVLQARSEAKATEHNLLVE